LRRKSIVLWRWAKPAKMFEPTENPYLAEKKFRSHNIAVRAGLNPIDWMRLLKQKGIVLHRIVLNMEEADLCVVAEGAFRPTEQQIREFIEKEGISLIGSRRRYIKEKYEESFVPLLEYQGDYNLPEVLIPFSVKGEVVYWQKLLVLFWRLKTWISQVRKSVD
jgi:hypothetical protein